jgi:hypothetical protein
MSRILAFSLLALFTVGCQVPTSPSTQIRISDRATLAPSGLDSVEQFQLCAITVEDGSPDRIVTYEGSVVALDAETITLKRPLMIAKQERKPPVFGRIPFLARQFKNIGMATEKLSRDVTIPRNEIVDFKKLNAG